MLYLYGKAILHTSIASSKRDEAWFLFLFSFYQILFKKILNIIFSVIFQVFRKHLFLCRILKIIIETQSRKKKKKKEQTSLRQK